MQLRNNIALSLIALLAFVQGALRTYFGLAGAGLLGTAAKDQVMSLIETPVSNELMVIALPFLLLGAVGLVANTGLVMSRPWGRHSTMIISIATIAYDLWAAATIQTSAILGMFVPLILMFYLTMRRNAFRADGTVKA
ncbi:MAG: hypothetical protein SA339_03285 [Methanomassiliicoccus sp.]|nr:hypothetical protein [Methanomassiliicoccus sp.]